MPPVASASHHPSPTESQALTIAGGRPLEGTLRVNNAKNSVLFLMLGSLLTADEVILEDVPRLSDVEAMADMLRHLGAEVTWQGRDLHIHAHTLATHSAPYHLVSKMRASFNAMGALLARCGEARISMPGGCTFGPRPVDRHIRAFKQLGVVIDDDMGDFHAKRIENISGKADFVAPTVGGTLNIMLASALGAGDVIIENAAREPEIVDLADMLNRMGADIQGAGTRVIEIRGVERLTGLRHRPIPDRIEAGTFMLAIAATRGKVWLENIRLEHLQALISQLRHSGIHIQHHNDRLLVDASEVTPQPLHVEAVEYPGFPTDLQAPLCAYLATVLGESSVRERVFPERFTHVEELRKCGVGVELEGDTMHIHGVPQLQAATLHAADIRAGGAMVIAGLAAQGTSIISGVRYIHRGYENLAERLREVGAKIWLGDEADSALATGTFGG